MSQKNLVYQAYGVEDVMRQTLFSVTSLLHALPEQDRTLKILIYTDQKKKFTDFFGDRENLEIVSVTMDQIKKWRGAIDFVHRVKVEILTDAAAKNPGTLLYCDGDTYFLSSPQSLFEKVNDRVSLMHVAENALDLGQDPLSKKILKFTKKHQFQIQNESIAILPATVMWNAGVLGLSEKNKALLEPVLKLTDQTYALYQKHVMEQLAFSFYLQRGTKIIAADAVIYHYWNQKPEYQKAIDDFLKQNPTIEQALANYKSFRWPPAPAIQLKKSLGQKILEKVLGK